jgi:hypothetical protein
MFRFAVLCCLGARATSSEPPLPISSGTYLFQHKDAEFPGSSGFPVTVMVRGRDVTVLNEQAGRSIPTGVIEEGRLTWHPASTKWILSSRPEDKHAPSVGGCGDSDPHTIDFKTREIWTCIGGP